MKPRISNKEPETQRGGVTCSVSEGQSHNLKPALCGPGASTVMDTVWVRTGPPATPTHPAWFLWPFLIQYVVITPEQSQAQQTLDHKPKSCHLAVYCHNTEPTNWKLVFICMVDYCYG